MNPQINCVLNGENQPEMDASYRLCGQKIIANTFAYSHKDITLFWKGHLYNRSIEQKSSIIDPLCIIRYYLKRGIHKTLRKINGDFSFVLLDPRITEENSVLYVAMDIFGKYPLYSASASTQGNEFCITDMLPPSPSTTTCRSFLPACYSVYSLSHKVHSIWTLQQANVPYYMPPIPMVPPIKSCSDQQQEQQGGQMRNLLWNNIQRRIEAHNITQDNAIAILLLEEQNTVCFQIVYNFLKGSGFSPLICSIHDDLLREEHKYSRIFVVSVAHKFYKEPDYTLHPDHTLVYPCMDVFYMQHQLLLGYYYYTVHNEK